MSDVALGDPIVIYGRREASVCLYFDGLPVDLRRRVRFLEPGPIARDLSMLGAASLVVMVRDILGYERRGLLAALAAMGTPVAWFLDDDFITLGREFPRMAAYTAERVADIARGVAAVVVTSPALAVTMGSMNPRVILWPCVFDVARAGQASSCGAALRVGCFGGAFRRRSFLAHVVPAAEALTGAGGVQLVASAPLAAGSDTNIVTTVPFQLDFAQFITEWRRLGLNGIAHPYGDTGNLANKGPGSVLAASYLGATPIVADEPAFADINETMGVLKAEASVGSWREAFERLSYPEEALRLFDRLEAWRRDSFDPEKARGPFEQLAHLARPKRASWSHATARARGLIGVVGQRLTRQLTL